MTASPALVSLASLWVVAASVMALAWRRQEVTRNATAVDVVWTLLVGALSVGLLYTGDGSPERRLAAALMLAAWSLRLATHLATHRLGHHGEDPRYTAWRREWAPHASRRFFWYFQSQALAAVWFSIPAWLIASDPGEGLRAHEWVAIVLFAVGLTGEWAADIQLTRFKSSQPGGRTCREGLWRFSRHPNYFFEWVVWVALALLAVAAPWGALALLCPAGMLYLLLRVTGIPASEAQALRSRGRDYERYQATTSRFVPWWPRHEAGVDV